MSENAAFWMPVLSLVVALLAVFAGPWAALKIGKMQIKASSHTANRQIVAPLRQQWIDTLRALISEFCSRCSEYRLTQSEPDADKLHTIAELVLRIDLYLNPKEDDHVDLLNEIQTMQSHVMGQEANVVNKFWASRKLVLIKAKKILKREWERVKTDV